MATKFVDVYDNMDPGSSSAPTPAGNDVGASTPGFVDVYDNVDPSEGSYTGHSDTTMSIQEVQNQRSKLRSHNTQTPRGGNPNLNPTGLMDSFTSGTIKHMDDKISFLASKRFPNDPNAAEKYRVNPAGEIVYEEQDGTWTLENESDEPFMGLQLGDAGRGIAKFLGRSGAEMAGSIAGGIAGGVSGAGAGGVGALPGSVIGSATGAAAGDGYRRAYAAAQGYPDRGGEEEAIQSLAKIAAIDAVGGGVMGAAGKAVNKVKLNRDWKSYDSTATDELQAKAQEVGIELTGAQATGLRSLINSEQSIGMGQDELADEIYKFLNKQSEQVEGAVEKFIGKTDRSEIAGRNIRDVNQGMIDDQKAARTAATKPLYNQSVKEEAVVPEELVAKMMEDQVIREAFDTASTDPLWRVMDHADNSMTKLQAVKKILNNRIGKAKNAGENEKVGALMSRKEQVQRTLNNASPGYKAADKQFAEESTVLKKLEDGTTGQLAKTKDTALAGLATQRLNKASSYQIAEMRKEFKLMGKEKEWDGVVNTYLRDKWEHVKDTVSGSNLNNGAKFKQAMLGSKAQRKAARELLGPEKFKGFSNLMDVLEATGRVHRGQSMTNAAGKADIAAKREAAPVKSAIKDAMNLNWFDWWIDANVETQKKIMLDIMTSPNSIKQLEELGKIRPLTAKQITRLNVRGSAMLDLVGELITSDDEVKEYMRGVK